MLVRLFKFRTLNLSLIKCFPCYRLGIGLCRFERYADGLMVMQEAGYTARELIQGATDVSTATLGLGDLANPSHPQGAALECGLAEVTGQLKAGYSADLAAFEGNPLEDLHNFFRPVFVMADGRRHSLTPIAPFGDQSAKIDVFKKMLSLASTDRSVNGKHE
jgi:hypothetical protein